MESVILFLEDLSRNNNKAWFDANKGRYLAARAKFEQLAGELIAGIRRFDGTIGRLAPADCLFRIYRDVRFSKDKSPYKNTMSLYINRGGKKSGYSGYYFQVGAGEKRSLVAIGDYWYPPEVLRVLREDIEMGGGDFRRILEAVDRRLYLDGERTLRRVPAGFPKDSPDAEFFKYKVFCLCYEPDHRFLTSPHLAKKLTEIFATTKPFVDYVNRAVEYCWEEKSDIL